MESSFLQFRSVQSLSRSVVSDSLRPHGLQYTRFPCPSPTPGACWNSCPSSQWCHPTISSSVLPFSCFQSFAASGSFPIWVSSLHQVAKILELQLQHQSFQWIFRTDLLWGWLFWSLCSPGILKSLLQNRSLKASVFEHSAFLLSSFHICTWLLAKP